MIRNRAITKELSKQGIRASDYYRYILRNPDNHEKLNEQAGINLKVAVKAYTKILKRRGHCHV